MESFCSEVNGCSSISSERRVQTPDLSPRVCEGLPGGSSLQSLPFLSCWRAGRMDSHSLQPQYFHPAVRARLSTGAGRQSIGEPSGAAPLTPALNQTRVLRAQRLMATKKEEPRTDVAGCNEKGLWSGAFIGNKRCSRPSPRITSLSRTEERCLLFINTWWSSLLDCARR